MHPSLVMLETLAVQDLKAQMVKMVKLATPELMERLDTGVYQVSLEDKGQMDPLANQVLLDQLASPVTLEAKDHGEDLVFPVSQDKQD